MTITITPRAPPTRSYIKHLLKETGFYLEELQRAMVDKDRDARGVMVIIVGNGHGDMSLNPGPS